MDTNPQAPPHGSQALCCLVQVPLSTSHLATLPACPRVLAALPFWLILEPTKLNLASGSHMCSSLYLECCSLLFTSPNSPFCPSGLTLASLLRGIPRPPSPLQTLLTTLPRKMPHHCLNLCFYSLIVQLPLPQGKQAPRRQGPSLSCPLFAVSPALQTVAGPLWIE